jgi:hypothetical protein
MKNTALSTAFERLIQPLPDQLKAAMLEAWKNEDIPHDENDSVYRLMVLLTLYAQFYQDMAMVIVAAADKINHTHVAHVEEVRSTLATQRIYFQNLTKDLRTIYASIADVRKVMDEKPKSLRSQLESEMKTVFFDLHTEGQKIISEFSSYTRRFKDDCEEWKAKAYFTFFLVGLMAGIAATLLVIDLINSHGS